MSVIQVQQLSKQFRTRVSSQQKTAWLTNLFRPQYRNIDAVKQVSFSVEEGEVVAFLGPNGAGKSTTIKMLTGILQPTGGSATVLGFDPAKQRRQLAWQIGSVFGQRSQLWFHLPPADSFRLLGAIYELEPAVLASRTAELVERFALQDYFDVAVRKLSLGQRIRCEIAASLLHKPRLLFLDEPTIGLDVVARREIRSLLSELNTIDKVTVFITSHDMGDIAKVCKRAIIIHHGEVVVDESMKDLKHRALAKKYVGVRYQEPVQFATGGLQPLKATDRSASFEIDSRQHSLPELVRHLSGLGELADITIEDEPLENVIADIYAARSEQAARDVTASGRAAVSAAAAAAAGKAASGDAVGTAATEMAGSGDKAAGSEDDLATGSGDSQAEGGTA